MSKEMNGLAEQMQEKAVALFCTRPENFPTGRPFNCCESVLLALRDYLGVEADIIPRIGTAIGAGVSLNGYLCGSISGAAIAIGVKFGRNESQENPTIAWGKMDEFLQAFKQKFKYVNCRELTGLDLKTAEGLKKYFADVHDYACANRMRFAIKKVVELIVQK